MRYTVDEPLKFKFQFLNEQGQATSLFSKKGEFDGEVLVLDKVSYPGNTLVAVERREQRMAVSALTSATSVETLALTFGSKAIAVQVKQALDVARSAHGAEAHRQDLVRRGRGGAYRDAECGQCGATIVLSDLPITPQLHCPYCDTLATIQAADDIPVNEHEFHLCDACHLFSRPQKFTVMYFWFVIVAYGYWTEEKFCCKGCMRGAAWKMLFGNLLFVLGVPWAAVQLIRSYSGSVVGGAFRGLDSGNVRARRGDAAGALKYYRSILERVPHSAGVKFNLGQGLIMQQDYASAAKSFEAALRDCANYFPAYGQLRQMYSHLGETEKLRELDLRWGHVERGESAADGETAGT